MAIAFHNVFISEAFQNCRRTPHWCTGYDYLIKIKIPGICCFTVEQYS